MGVGEKDREPLPADMEKRLTLLEHQDLVKKQPLQNAYDRLKGGPVYISIDKDVLKPEALRTNWSQGIMEVSELKEILRELFTRFEVIGVDICGECGSGADDSAVEQNDRFNREILCFIQTFNPDNAKQGFRSGHD